MLVKDLLLKYVSSDGGLDLRLMYQNISEDMRRDFVSTMLSYLASRLDEMQIEQEDKMAISVLAYELVSRITMDEAKKEEQNENPV